MSQCALIDIEGSHPQIATQYDADSGNAIPLANVLTINGMTVANGLYATPIFTTGSGNTITINQQVGKAITGSPADKNDAGLVSFDDTIFSVTEHGYVSLLGGGLAIDSFLTDVAGPTQPTGAGEVTVTGTSIFSDGSVANTLTLNVQATANTFLLGAGTDTNATELGPLTNGQLIIGSTGLAPVAGTLSVLTVANATNATPLFVDVGAGTLNLDLQVATVVTGAPADKNDAGICSFDDTEFVVDANGFVSLAGLAGAPAIQKLDGDGGGVVGPDAAGKVTIRGLTVANATRSKPLWIEDNPGANSVAHEIQVSAAITGAPADKNNAGIASFDDTEFTVDANGFVQLAGTGAGQTITGDSGGALSPTAGNWNILGLGESSTSGSGSTLSILSPRVTTWIVDPTANVGTHQTIGAAITAASSGDTIFIRPGTYVENITLPAGITIVGTPSTENIGQTILNGKITQTATGTSSVSHLRITTNADVCVDIGGTGIIQTSFKNCWFFLSDADCLTCNNSNASPVFSYCQFNQTGASFDLFNITSCNEVLYERCRLLNTGVTPGVSNIAAGQIKLRYSQLEDQRFTTSGAANFKARYSQFYTFTDNVTPITTAGTGANHEIEMCYFRTGTAVAIVCGSGTTMVLDSISINSQNAAPVTATGTVNYTSKNYTGGITFDGGANVLDQYEEGTWTPALTGASGAPTIAYTTQTGTYTRIGNTVFVRALLAINTISGGSGSARLTGLPFTANASSQNIGNVQFNGVNFESTAAYVTARVDQNTAYTRFFETIANAGGATVDISDFANGDNIALTVSYIV